MTSFVEKPEDPTLLWKSTGGRNWVQSQQLIDHLFEPIERLLVDAVECKSPMQVLDIGCGTGGTTHAVSHHTANGGRATGIDISQIMVDAAQATMKGNSRAIEFICADAETYIFEPAQFQMIMSRFGIMFFENPVRAFENLRRAATSDANGLFITWRAPSENPFMTTAGAAAKQVIALPDHDPDAPGQFAFSHPEYVEGILSSAGWRDIRIEPLDFECTFATSELVGFFTRLGPLGRIFSTLDGDTKTELVQVVSAAFDPFVIGDQVKFTAACWQIKTRASEAGRE